MTENLLLGCEMAVALLDFLSRRFHAKIVVNLEHFACFVSLSDEGEQWSKSLLEASEEMLMKTLSD